MECSAKMAGGSEGLVSDAWASGRNEPDVTATDPVARNCRRDNKRTSGKTIKETRHHYREGFIGALLSLSYANSIEHRARKE
jgi:hypothetical protein